MPRAIAPVVGDRLLGIADNDTGSGAIKTEIRAVTAELATTAIVVFEHRVDVVTLGNIRSHADQHVRVPASTEHVATGERNLLLRTRTGSQYRRPIDSSTMIGMAIAVTIQIQMHPEMSQCGRVAIRITRHREHELQRFEHGGRIVVVDALDQRRAIRIRADRLIAETLQAHIEVAVAI